MLPEYAFEYERKGTRNIFAAFNVRDGRVLLWVTPDRTTPMVLSFLDHIVRHYRRGPIVIITDNISTRTGDAAVAWLENHPRVRFVFTPTHGSWLNQVEIWFGILTRSALRHRSFANVRELAAAIDADPARPYRREVVRLRSVVERACHDVLDAAGRALGPGPLCGDHAHAQRCADLSVFVRQSHADRDWAALGQDVAALEGDAPWPL